ncbi:hypothetical protein GCM10010983_35540 [Caulobacter rhizosphaerae]|nr:hypothetical protein GCM10010983_35540 [Caulobacter rhizosphaerae]
MQGMGGLGRGQGAWIEREAKGGGQEARNRWAEETKKSGLENALAARRSRPLRGLRPKHSGCGAIK